MNYRNRLQTSALLCLPLLLLTACADDGDDGMATPGTTTGAGSESTGAGPGTTGDASSTTGDDSADTTGDGPEETGSESGADTGSTGGPTIVVSGDYTDFLAGNKVQDATICVRNQPDVECVTTDSAGAFELVQVEPGPIVLQFEHEDSAIHITHVSGEEDFSAFQTVLSRAAVTLLAELSGGKVDPTRGAVALSAVGQIGTGVEGVTAELSDSEGAIGPIYLNEDGLPDLEATATSNAGFYGWANVSPGEHTLTVSHPTRTCTNSLDPDGSAGITMEVIADGVTSSWNYECI